MTDVAKSKNLLSVNVCTINCAPEKGVKFGAKKWTLTQTSCLS